MFPRCRCTGPVAVRKGAKFTAALDFEIASTNLVIELGIIMSVLLAGSSPWQSSSAAR